MGATVWQAAGYDLCVMCPEWKLVVTKMLYICLLSYEMKGPWTKSIQGGSCLSFYQTKKFSFVFFFAAAFTLIQRYNKAGRVVGDCAARGSHIINITVESGSSLCRWCWISKACDGQPQHDTDCSDRKVEPGSTSSLPWMSLYVVKTVAAEKRIWNTAFLLQRQFWCEWRVSEWGETILTN